MLTRSRDSLFREGDHDIPIAFAISVRDGSFNLDAETLLNDAAGPKTPALLKPFFSDFTIDEQLVRITLDFQDSPNERYTAEGIGEFQTIGHP